ncbi:hypothetical protein [Rhodococcus sp. YH3-3]|nr:hypothetical protein [Rhodococcus sp. YH3-3]
MNRTQSVIEICKVSVVRTRNQQSCILVHDSQSAVQINEIRIANW